MGIFLLFVTFSCDYFTRLGLFTVSIEQAAVYCLYTSLHRIVYHIEIERPHTDKRKQIETYIASSMRKQRAAANVFHIIRSLTCAIRMQWYSDTHGKIRNNCDEVFFARFLSFHLFLLICSQCTVIHETIHMHNTLLRRAQYVRAQYQIFLDLHQFLIRFSSHSQWLSHFPLHSPSLALSRYLNLFPSTFFLSFSLYLSLELLIICLHYMLSIACSTLVAI